jgi:ATP adenylyltransferase
MEYILKPKGGSCVFCDYAQAEASSLRSCLVLVATQHTYVVMNRYPFASGHLLVIPNRHASTLDALPCEEYEDLFALVRECTVRLKQAVRAQGLNVGINMGEAAGAGIAEHLHVHIVPRWHGDTNFMPVLADVRAMPQHLDETYALLLPFFADVPGRKVFPGEGS